MPQEYSADHDIADFIGRRWSPRAFAERPVEREKLLSLLEAARWAPSAFNEQPWRFILATKDDRPDYDRMLSCLADSNQVWVRRAPVIAILVVKSRFDHNGKPNRWAQHDAGLALENLMLQAFDSGLVTHPMAGFSHEKIREEYGVPEEFEPLVAIAIGYPGDPDALPPDLKERELAPRERNKIATFAFSGRWGNAVPQ